MAAHNVIAIDLGRRRLRAVGAVVDRGRLKVTGSLVEALPADLSPDDPRALGAWMGEVLARGGFSRGRATVAISREHVVMKRLTLPTSDGGELPEMTRLALRRELPFDAEGAVIDYVVIEQSEKSTTVMAVAAPLHVLTAVRQAARSAGLTVERLSVRCMGAAALFAAGREPGAVLAVDITAERVEFSVVVDGVIRFSRAGELPPLDDPARVVSAIVTEARRTWMSYRIAPESQDVRRLFVIGQAEVAGEAAGSLGDALGVEAEILRGHPLVDDGGAGDPGEVWSLAGLLLAPALALPTIDFAHPRRPPDVAGRRRRLALGAAGLAAVVILAGTTVARFHLDGLRRRVTALESVQRARLPQYVRYGRDLYRLRHLRAWEAGRPDWLAHLDRIAGMAPPAEQLVLDGWSGALAESDVRFDRDADTFSTAGEIRIVLEGEAVDRRTADAYRGRLVDAEVYDMSTTGPDAGAGRRLPYAFQYRLRTPALALPGDEPSSPGGEGAGRPASDARPRLATGAGRDER